MTKIVCTKCSMEKDSNCFYPDKKKLSGFRSDCKECYNKRQAERRVEWMNKPVDLIEKECSLCKEVKAIESFNKDVTQQSGYYPRCKECAKIGKKMYLQEYRIQHSKERRNYTLRAKFNISLQEADSLIERSLKNTCEMCGKHQKEGKKKSLSVDHCHATNQVRGLLCHNCNLVLGHSLESVEILNSAVKYLEKYSSSNGLKK